MDYTDRKVYKLRNKKNLKVPFTNEPLLKARRIVKPEVKYETILKEL